MEENVCRIEYHPDYFFSLEEIYWKHFDLVGINSAERITDNLKLSVKFLSENPYMGHKATNHKLAKKGYRTLVCGNYLCFYKVEKDVVFVRRIVDGRTDYLKNFEW